MEISAFPVVTAGAAALLGLLQAGLMFYTAMGRGKYQTGLGDGGQEGLLQRIRMHGNLTENAPIFLILLGLLEMSGQFAGVTFPIAAAFVVARMSHAYGLSQSTGTNPFRLVGALVTLLILAGLSVMLGLSVFG